MNQQERLEKKYDDNADCFSINGYDIIGMDKQTFIRVASELLEERWIRVEERKPDKGEYVLCINDERQSVCTFDSAPNKSEPKFYLNDRDYWSEHEGVTHWQKLPQPPNT